MHRILLGFRYSFKLAVLVAAVALITLSVSAAPLQDGDLAVISAAPTDGSGPIALGYLVYDVLFPGNFGEFDIVNQTGPNNSLPEPDFPVTNTVSFVGLSLIISFSDGTTH